MNFKELEKIENFVAANEFLPNPFNRIILVEFLENKNDRVNIADDPFNYFYEDIIESTLDFDFKKSLGNKIYENATTDALTCLNSCVEFKRMNQWKVASWLDLALKFADNFVLHYIQEHCKELPQATPGNGLEKSRYIQLSKKNGEIGKAGSMLEELYNFRNGITHQTKTYQDGRQEIIKPQLNKIRYKVNKMYPSVLRNILRTYKEIKHF